MNNITIIPIKNLPEFSPKHDLADELIKGFENNNISLEDNDVIVVTQKIVSKVENRLIENNFENIEELIEKEEVNEIKEHENIQELEINMNGKRIRDGLTDEYRDPN